MTLSRDREQPWAPSYECFQKMRAEPKVILDPPQKPILRLWDTVAEPVEVMGLPVKTAGK